MVQVVRRQPARTQTAVKRDTPPPVIDVPSEQSGCYWIGRCHGDKGAGRSLFDETQDFREQAVPRQNPIRVKIYNFHVFRGNPLKVYA